MIRRLLTLVPPAPLQIQPDNIEVASIASRVGNGEVWILKGVRNYA